VGDFDFLGIPSIRVSTGGYSFLSTIMYALTSETISKQRIAFLNRLQLPFPFEDLNNMRLLT
jgi:hypothetical protein